jgi:hypothetical protein
VSTPIDKVAVTAAVAGTTVSGTTSAWMLWFAENHHAIASLCAMGSLTIAAIGLCVHWYYAAKRARVRRDWLD